LGIKKCPKSDSRHIHRLDWTISCSEAVVYVSALFICLAAIVVVPPPFVCLVVLALVVTLLVPGLGTEQDVCVLDFVVSPDCVVYTFPTHGLEGIVDVGKSNPSAREEVAKHGLIGKLVGCGD